MPNIAALLKDEITRLSNRAVRRQLAPVRSKSATQRRTIAALRKQVAALERDVKALRRSTFKPPVVNAGQGTTGRFVAKGLVSMRKRLGLSASELGTLLSVSALSVYNWEHKKTRPRSNVQGAIAALRSIGKREARARLQALGAPKEGGSARNTREAKKRVAKPASK